MSNTEIQIKKGIKSNRGSLSMKSLSTLLLSLITVLILSSCGDPSANCPFCRDEQDVGLEGQELMAVRVRWSALEEAAYMIDPSTVCEDTPSDALFRRNIRANSCIFVPQCKIFLGQIAVPNNYGFFQDTDLSVGIPGDVVIDYYGDGNYGLSSEMISLGEMAHDHWSAYDRGILAIAVNRFILADGSLTGVRGYAIPPTNTQRPLVYIVDPSLIPSGVDSEHVFAHEVGHSLGLCHTNECDQLDGDSSIQNLMDPDGSVNSTRLVESQCVAARTIHPSIFENTARSEFQPELRMNHRRETVSVSNSGGTVIQGIQISSKTSDKSALSLTLRTKNPINSEKMSFWISLDLDRDTNTGLNTGTIVPQGRHEGADLIVNFVLDKERGLIESGLLKAVGSSFAQLTLPTDGMQLNINTIHGHSMSDTGCTTHPAFDEISFEIPNAIFTEIRHPKPTSAKALELIKVRGVTLSYLADGNELMDTFRPRIKIDSK
ncbi:MAG: hypothetical protein L3J24_03175 [Xanthomonadales bacterium]|nr:hypothetical protein [Xanthomonadales bacterium]